MHVNSAVVSANLKNCYDAVHHPIISIAVQGMVVPVLTVKLVLLYLQTMLFWLKTAHGILGKNVWWHGNKTLYDKVVNISLVILHGLSH